MALSPPHPKMGQGWPLGGMKKEPGGEWQGRALPAPQSCESAQNTVGAQAAWAVSRGSKKGSEGLS